jgi:hypothetical protein
MFNAVAGKDSRLRILFSASLEDDEAAAGAALLRIPTQSLKVSTHGKCRLCVENWDLHHIDTKTQERTLIEPGRKIRLTKGRVQPAARFWGLVDESDAVRLHYDDTYNHRHHPVYIELKLLLARPEFRRRCLRTLRKMKPPGLVLIPGNPSSGVIRSLLEEVIPDVETLVLPAGSNRIPDAWHPRLVSHKRLWVADDALITGQTISDLKMQIYDMCKKYRRSTDLEVFVVLARPDGASRFSGLKNRLFDHQGVRLHFAWEVYLPYPSKGECPLCLEQSILHRSTLQLPFAHRNAVNQRLLDLRGSLRDPLRGSEDERRIAGSFYIKKSKGEAQDALPRTVFAAVQSAAIALADEAHTLSSTDGRMYRVDDADLLDKSLDAEIFGALFRTLSRKVLSWPGNSEAIRARLADFPSKAPSEDFLVEMGWAAALGRLPAESVIRILEEAGESNRVKMMRELISMMVM